MNRNLLWSVVVALTLLLWGGVVGSAHSATLPTLGVTGDTSTAEISNYVRIAIDYDGEISKQAIATRLSEFKPVGSRSMQLQIEGKPFLMLLEVENLSASNQSWVLTTRRHSVQKLSIHEVSETSSDTLFDGHNKHAYPLNIRRYIGFGTLLDFEPGERKLIAIEAVLENTDSLPVQIWTYQSYLDEYFQQNTKFTIILSAMIVIILINFMLFIVNREFYFFLLIGAEICFALLIAHSVNYLDVAGLARFPEVSLFVAELLKCFFLIFMASFARLFLATEKNFPAFDVVLKGCMILGALLSLLWGAELIVGGDYSGGLRNVTWGSVCVAGLAFPFVGYQAVRKFGLAYTPLMIGWSFFALFGVYVISLTTLWPEVGIPRGATLMAITGLLEAFFVTLALGWRIILDKDQHSKILAAHAAGLEEKLALAQENLWLAEEKEIAVATVRDQNALLQASGHDTKQVVLAINNAAHYVEGRKSPKDERLLQTLKSSADFLNDILATTVAAPSLYSADKKCIALSSFKLEQFLTALERIYRPLFSRKGLYFEISIPSGAYVISDKALLMRTVSNFLANALQNTSTGGVQCRATITHDTLHLEIKDTGKGMPPDKLRSLMGKQSPSKGGVQTQGSGFIIARTLIDSLGGKLEVESDGVHGTAIRINLPLAYLEVTKVDMQEWLQLEDLPLYDLDNPPQKLGLETHEHIGITRDDSAQMRSRMGKNVRLFLYKPVVDEMLNHPLVREFRSSSTSSLD